MAGSGPRRRRAWKGPLLAGLGVLLGVVGGLAGNASTSLLSDRWLHGHGWLVLAVTGVAALGCVVVGVALYRHDQQSVGEDGGGGPPLAEIADRLAVAVGAQWNTESEYRRINDPWPLPVWWGPADPGLFDGWEALQRLAAAGAGPPTPSGPAVSMPGLWVGGAVEPGGGDRRLVEVLERVPTGRLVVLGEPGSGKTALLVGLVLDLVARREPGGPVPFLVPLASWKPLSTGLGRKPGGQSLTEWLETRLILGHPALANPAPADTRITRARALLEAGLITPVLDGLDEIPDGLRGQSIARINDATRPGRRLVLAARTGSYRQTVRSEADIEVRLTGAAGIELQPLDTTTVAQYLRDSAGGPNAAARWEPVLAAGTDEPNPVLQALTTPLMATLARTIYNPRPGEYTGDLPDPEELLRKPDQHAVENHLFDGYLPAAYRPHPDPTRRSPWTARQAEHWLVFLARHLQDNLGGTPDFTWWQIPLAVSPHRPNNLRLAAALTVGLTAGLTLGLVGLWVDLAAGLSFGVFGLAAGLAAWLTARPARPPGQALRWHPDKSGLFGLAIGLTFGFIALMGALGEGATDWLTFGLRVGLAAGCAGGLVAGLKTSPAELTSAADPRSFFVGDRAAFRSTVLVAVLATGLAFGLAGGRLAAGLAFGLAGALPVGLSQTAWGWVVGARGWLALRRRLPYHLMAFLADAHENRGVLRQVGAVYQFRHLELQRRLAAHTPATD
jgi:GTPase SAR1 family protein